MSLKQNEIFYESYKEAKEEQQVKNINKKHDKKTLVHAKVQMSA